MLAGNVCNLGWVLTSVRPPNKNENENENEFVFRVGCVRWTLAGKSEKNAEQPGATGRKMTEIASCNDFSGQP